MQHQTLIADGAPSNQRPIPLLNTANSTIGFQSYYRILSLTYICRKENPVKLQSEEYIAQEDLQHTYYKSAKAGLDFCVHLTSEMEPEPAVILVHEFIHQNSLCSGETTSSSGKSLIAKKNGFASMQMLSDDILMSEEWTANNKTATAVHGVIPYLVGIALVSLSAGSQISVEVRSPDEADYTFAFKEKIRDLTQTFEKIANSIPQPFNLMSLSLPSFVTEEGKEAIVKAAKAVPAFAEIWLRTLDNMEMVSNALNKVSYPPQNELILEIGPDAASIRLVSTMVEAGVRMTDIEKQFITRDIGSSNLVAKLVDPALAALKELSTEAPLDHPYKIVVKPPCLKRVLILASSLDSVSSLLQHLKSKFEENSLPVEILVETNLARYAADSSVDENIRSIGFENGFMTMVVPLRVGIVKADGFVSTVIQRHASLPRRGTFIFTTSEDQQETATIRVVVGVPPEASNNTGIAELCLKGLTPRPQGIPHIEVSFRVEQMGKTRITAEEVMEGGVIGSTASVELKDILGNTLTWDDVKIIQTKYLDIILSMAAQDDEAQKSEDRWTGKEAQGDLPE